MREFATILTVTGVILWTGGATLADTVVVEELTGSAGDWTYTYTLTNGEASDIWHWCVWFPSNPNSNLVTAGTANWSATNLATHGFFPE